MTKPTAEATKRPWNIDDKQYLVDSSGVTIGLIDTLHRPTEENEANSALICKAVNEYEALNAVAEAAVIGHAENCAKMHCHLCQCLNELTKLRQQ